MGVKNVQLINFTQVLNKINNIENSRNISRNFSLSHVVNWGEGTMFKPDFGAEAGDIVIFIDFFVMALVKGEI